MPVVVGIQFKPVTKLYHFSPGEYLDLASNDFVIVDTAKGQEVAQVVQPPHLIDESDVVGEMKGVVRRANAWDLVQKDLWEHKEREALAICRAKARRTARLRICPLTTGPASTSVSTRAVAGAVPTGLAWVSPTAQVAA